MMDLIEKIILLIENRKFIELRKLLDRLEPADIAELIEELKQSNSDYEVIVFRLLNQDLSVRSFELLPFDIQDGLLKGLGDKDLAAILDEMSPDDRTELFEELPGKVMRRLLNLLSAEERQVAQKLLGYPEDSIGRLMTPDYVAIKPHWTVQDVLEHIRKFGHNSETLNTLYVVEKGGKLIDDIDVNKVLLADPDTKVSELMDHQFVALSALDDQEEAVNIFQKHDRVALPVVNTKGILVGIVTIDDVFDIAEEEATEDMQKLAAVEALDEPYMTISLPKLIRKRSFWLIVLFFGQMLTATALDFFQDELSKALVLAVFIPLIISSGGNTGSQAATLIIRALTIGEIRLRDWWRVMKRELLSGLIIGSILGVLGFLRIAVVQNITGQYGEHWLLLATTMTVTLVAVVIWGTLSGSLLPFVLKRLGVDPATSSAPLVSTLSDVTGLVIYFSIAAFILRGTLL